MRRHLLWVCALAVALGWPALAETSLSLTCVAAACERTEDVISVPLGAVMTLQATDKAQPIFDVIWTFEGLGRVYGSNAQYQFNAPGKYQAEALIVYKDMPPRSVTFTVHVLVAPERPNNTKLPQLFGLPNEITYPVVAALALLIASWLNSLAGG